MKGWKKTAFGQKYNHYFEAGGYRPICKAKAMFTSAEATIRPMSNFVCLSCTRKIMKSAPKERR